MMPNRVVRYFYYLGYALGQYGHTTFPAFQNALVDFYSVYVKHEYYVKKPLRYPSVYGLN